jgi:hypothetical protein
LKLLFVDWPRHFDGPKLRQMIGYELRIKQHKAACTQARHQMTQGDFAGIAGTAKHAFAKKRPA